MQAIVTELLMLQSKTKVFLVTSSDSGQRVNNNLFKGKTKWLRLRTVLFEVRYIKISLQIEVTDSEGLPEKGKQFLQKCAVRFKSTCQRQFL